MASIFKNIELAGRSFLMRIFSALFAPKNVLEQVPANEKIERIILLRQDKIGDMVVSLPAIRAVREKFPDAKIALLVSERNSQIVKYEREIEKIFYRKAPHKFLSSLLEVRKFRPDTLVDLQMKSSTTSMLYAIASGAKWKIGAQRTKKSPFNVQVSIGEDLHIIDSTVKIVSALCGAIDIEAIDRSVRLSEIELAFAQKSWARIVIDPQKSIAVNISAGSHTRFWGEQNFIKLCKFIRSKNYTPLIFYAPDDRAVAKTISDAVSETKMIPETPTILHSAAILQKTKMLISPDTSIIHIAAGFDIPVIGLYPKGRENKVRWGPRNPNSRIVQSDKTNSLGEIDVKLVEKNFMELVE